MKWRDIQIIDKNDKVYRGMEALEYVETNYKPFAYAIRGELIEVNTYSPAASTDDKEVWSVLSSKLFGKVKSLRFLKGEDSRKTTLPVARAVQNVFNLNRAKLKVEIIYKRHPKSKIPRKYLEDSVVTVTASCEGATTVLTSTITLTKDTDKGIADFGVVEPGKYTITPDYSKLDECKYDWIPDEKREVLLEPLSVETVEFQVEPLYQQVEFIAHSLATIPHFIFKASEEDKKKFDVTESDGKKTFKFKNQPQSPTKEYYAWGELSSEIRDKALRDIKTINTVKTNTIKMRKNNLTNQFYKFEEIEEELEKEDNKNKIELGAKISDSPEVYVFTFKEKAKPEIPYTAGHLEGEWKSKYHGFIDDVKDIEARVKFVEDTLEKAYAKANQNPTVLKVFMIPECYFQGLYGAYISDDAAELLEKLQNLVKAEKWKDWIFGFGTVNRVFLGLQPQSVTTEDNRTIYEMANHAPVIRGGLEFSNFFREDHSPLAGDSFTRLIQKLVNSLELAGEGDLIKDAKVTELVEKKKEIFKEKDELVKQHKLAKVELEKDFEIEGVAAKRIRPQAVNEAVQFEATENEEKVARLLEILLEDNIKKQFNLVTDEINAEIKKIGIVRVAREIRAAKDDDSLYSQWKKTLQDYEKILDEAQELDWKARLEKAENLEATEKLKEIEKVRKEKESKNPVAFKYVRGSMNLEDYVFACPRKAGPLFNSLAEAKKVKSCKRLVFGLEICADHGDWRIIEINTGENFIDIDIQLVPSAGQKPRKFAARKAGYIFNCDGWNQPPDGGKKLETHLDGPSPFIRKENDLDKQTSPIYPHSAVAKRTEESILVEKPCLEPESGKTEIPSADLSKVIFTYGPGELHFYPLQELPK